MFEQAGAAAESATYGDAEEPRKGFFTDTTLCIGCKACEVACKEWNELPADGYTFSGQSYDNTSELNGTKRPRAQKRARPNRFNSATSRNCALVRTSGCNAYATARSIRTRACTCAMRTTGSAARARSSCCSTNRKCTGCRPTRSIRHETSRRSGAPRPTAPLRSSVRPRCLPSAPAHECRRCRIVLRASGRQAARVDAVHPLVFLDRRRNGCRFRALRDRTGTRQRFARRRAETRRSGRRDDFTGAAHRRSRRAATVHQHAARLQGHLADERRLVDPYAPRRNRVRVERCGLGRRAQARAGLGISGGAARAMSYDLHRGADRRHRDADLERGVRHVAVRVRREAGYRARARAVRRSRHTIELRPRDA